MKQTATKLPIGIQSFEQIRTGGYMYIDKTGYIRDLVNEGKYYFLSRPRRFGKSLLISTLEAYFRGQKELFEDLEISGGETAWTPYPVLHLDLNTSEYKGVDDLRTLLSDFVSTAARRHGVTDDTALPVPLRFKKLVENISAAESRNVVILVDEYDKPLLSAVDDADRYGELQSLLKAFYGVIKTCDSHIRFAMITGVGRFGHVSVFSDLNNLNDISIDEEYNGLCGVSESELSAYFGEYIESMASRNRLSADATAGRLREMYDGYRFSNPEFTEGIYNPFSLLNALKKRAFGEYWFESGTPTFLIKLLMNENFDFSRLEFDVRENVLKGVNVPDKSVVALLYQTGYLTIKRFDPVSGLYTIGLPNREVESGFYSLSYSVYSSANETEFDSTRFCADLREGNVEGFMQRLKSLFASVPHEQAINTEATFHNLIFLLFTLLGYQTGSETHVSKGVSDLVVRTQEFVYIFEFKYGKTSAEAMKQIADRRYAAPYAADGRQIVTIGVNFSPSLRNIDTWESRTVSEE